MGDAKNEEDIHADFAKKAAKKLIEDYCDCKCSLTFKSDDGGKVMQISVETLMPSLPLLDYHPQFPIEQIFPKFCGSRTIILKVPIGYLSSL